MMLQEVFPFLKHVATGLCESPSVVLGLLFIAGFVLIRNLLFPLFADDFLYLFIWDRDHGGNFCITPQCQLQRVRTLRDVVSSQRSHYLVTGGRSVAHFLDQLFLRHGKMPFNLANTIVLLLQLFIISSLGAKGYVPLEGSVLLWIAWCFWFCTPHLASICQWMTGSFNYLWMGVLQSFFVLPYGFRCSNSAFHVHPVLMALLGLLAGWSNEAGAGASFLFAGISTLRSYRLGEPDLGWMLVGLLFCLIGLLVMLFAPGNFRRVELGDAFAGGDPSENPDRTEQGFYFTRVMLWHHFRHAFLHVLLLQLPMHLTVLLYFTPLGMRTPEVTERILMLELVCFAIPCALMFSPEFPLRAAYPSLIYGLGASCEAIRHLGGFHLPGGRAFLLGTLLLSGAFAVRVDLSLYLQARKRIRKLKEATLMDKVTLPKLHAPRLCSLISGGRAMDNYALQFDLDEDAGDCYNLCMAQYYGVGEISAEKTEGRDLEE